MFRVVKEQLRALGLLAQQNFVEMMVEHLYAFSPDHAESLGPKALQRIIDIGIERAGKYGFTQRGPVQLYIELMILLGSDFDTDPLFEWPSIILNRPRDDEDQLRRASEMFASTTRYLDVAAGPKNQHAIDALRRMTSGWFDFAPDSSPDVVEQLLQKLHSVAPEKCSFVGHERLELFVQRGILAARANNAEAAADQSLVVMLMFEFGHGCLTDPQFPWIRLALENKSTRDSHEVFQNLRRKVRLYLEHVLDNSLKRHAHT